MTNQTLLNVQGLHAALESGEEILRGVDLTIQKGEVHVIMGPNGSGKSTLANTIMGNPVYQVTGGQIEFDGEDITEARADVRAKKGIFMAFQAPEEIDGITVTDFIKTAQVAKQQKPIKFLQFKSQMKEALETLQLDSSYANRYLNVGFSGGEKKKSEILQLLTLQPKLAILDETDSGLDVDAVRVVTKGILDYKNEDNALLIISHSPRLLENLPVDYVHILSNGKFVSIGNRDLIDEINTHGFARFIQAESK
jgi:Fe-S cluster assembly ATP-binding protein